MLFLVTTQLEYLYLGFSNICNFNKKEIVHFYVHLNGVSDPDSNEPVFRLHLFLLLNIN